MLRREKGAEGSLREKVERSSNKKKAKNPRGRHGLLPAALLMLFGSTQHCGTVTYGNIARSMPCPSHEVPQKSASRPQNMHAMKALKWCGSMRYLGHLPQRQLTPRSPSHTMHTNAAGMPRRKGGVVVGSGERCCAVFRVTRHLFVVPG